MVGMQLSEAFEDVCFLVCDVRFLKILYQLHHMVSIYGGQGSIYIGYEFFLLSRKGGKWYVSMNR